MGQGTPSLAYTRAPDGSRRVGARQRLWFPLALAAASALGLYVQWPSLDSGFRGDDYVQRAMYRGEFPAARSPLDLFAFAAGTPDDYQRLVDFGHLPWWTHPQLRLRMWRPLASALMALDFRLFDTDARLHHVHSLGWYLLLLWSVGRLLWRVLPPPAAGLALLMFATAPCHTLPVGWLANRSSLTGSALAFLAIDLALVARERPGLWRGLGVALVSCIALSCGEYALAALVSALAFYALSPALPASRPQLTERVRLALPVLLPLAGYLVLHSLSGSEIRHSGYYISPFGAPLAFARAVLTRVPVLAADLLLGLPSFQYSAGSPLRNWLLSKQLISPEIWVRLPDWTSWHVAIGYAALAWGVGLYWVAAQRPRAERAPAWLYLGALASLVPCAGSLPEDRLLIAATPGAYALCACVLCYAPRVWSSALTRSPKLMAALAWLSCAWLLVSSISRSYDDVRNIQWGSDVARAWCLDADLPRENAAQTRVYVLAAADFNTAVNLPWVRLLEQNLPPPQSYRRLSTGPMPLRLTRESDRSLVLDVLTSDLYGSAVPALYRDAASPVRVGERHSLPGLEVSVLEVMYDNPARVRFEFDRSLDDPSLWFLVSSSEGLRRRQLPAVGEQLQLPYAQYGDVRK